MDPPFYKFYTETLRATAADLGMRYVDAPTNLKQAYIELDPQLPSYTNDLDFFSVEMNLEDPEYSVRFMFRSKEGARLPDPTGRIETLLAGEFVDFTAINDLLWDDSIVWPLGHTTYGLWVHKKVDLSQVNMISIAPQWIGFKE